jgi:hypothetical protein
MLAHRDNISQRWQKYQRKKVPEENTKGGRYLWDVLWKHSGRAVIGELLSLNQPVPSFLQAGGIATYERTDQRTFVAYFCYPPTFEYFYSAQESGWMNLQFFFFTCHY